LDHPLNPLLVALNNELGNMGVRRDNVLWFYTPGSGYKIWIRRKRFFVTRFTKVTVRYGPEPIPMLSGGDMAQVRAVLPPTERMLSPELAVVEWRGQEKYDKDYVQYENPFES
jgi:hypothetical protein